MGKTHFGIERSNSRLAPNAEAPGRFRRFYRDDRDTERVVRRRTTVLVPRDRKCRRSAVVPVPVLPDAEPADAPPSPRLPNPDPGWIGSLGASRFPGRCRFEPPSGAPFLGLLGGGRGRRFDLDVGPLLTGFPIGVDLLAKLAPGGNLLLSHSGLLGSQKPRPRFACHGLREAEVRTVAGIGILVASATSLATLD